MADEKIQTEKTGDNQKSRPTTDHHEYISKKIEFIRDEIFSCEMLARTLKQAINPQGKIPENDPVYRDILAMQRVAAHIGDTLHEQIAELWNLKHQLIQSKPKDLH